MLQPVGEDSPEPAVARVSVLSVVPVGGDVEWLESDRRVFDLEVEDLREVFSKSGWHGRDEVGISNDDGRQPERRYRPDDSTLAPDAGERCLGGSTSSATSITHEMLEVFDLADILMYRALATYQRDHAGPLTVPYVNAVTYRDGLFDRYEVFIDTAPLFAPTH